MHVPMLSWLTDAGVKFGMGVTRTSAKERWAIEGLDTVKGLPWDLHPDQVRAPRAVRADGEAPRLPPPRRELESSRSFYVQKKRARAVKQ